MAERIGLILLGPPGAGKGTQAEGLSARLGVPHISTGDMLREALASGTEVGLQAKKYMDAGELVPDAVVVAIVAGHLSRPDCGPGWLLDGFPRNQAQAVALAGELEKIGHEITAVLYLKVSAEDVVKRLSGRRMCRECNAGFHVEFMPSAKGERCDRCGGELYQRDDDCPETISQRLEVYESSTAGLVAYYRERGLLREVDAAGRPEEVGVGLVAAVEAAGVGR